MKIVFFWVSLKNKKKFFERYKKRFLVFKVDLCEIVGVFFIVIFSCDFDFISVFNVWNLKKESNFFLKFWCMLVVNFF